MGQEGLTLRDKQGEVVANIRFERFGDEVSIEKSEVTPEHQGKGYGYLVYSELLERLRSEGVKTVSGMVIDNAERPIKIRKRLIDVENLRIGEKDSRTEILDKRLDQEGNKQIDVESYLHQKARYQPSEYQGGDDYWKPKKNIFEYKDQEGLLVRRPFVGNDEITGDKNARGYLSNPADYNLDWTDIGHYPQIRKTKELNRWEIENSGLWVDDINKGILTKNPASTSDNTGYTHSEWMETYQYDEDKPPVYGRYEKPRYDSKGKLLERGKFSITSRYSDHFSSMSEVYEYKNKIAKKLGVNPEDVDAFYFGANSELKKQLGYGSRDNLPVKFQPAEGETDWNTARAIKARENQPRELWRYPDTKNFRSWAERLKFIGSEEDSNKASNYDKGFVTTVYKGVNVRSFDRFSERSVVDRNERSLTTDPNFFIADESAAKRYAGGGHTDISGLNEDAQKVASRGNADMYYVKSKNPANLLSAHKLEQANPKLFEAIKEFWNKNIKEQGHDVLDPRTSIDRFLLEIATGNWLSPKKEQTMLKPFGESWRMDNWIDFHEHLLRKGYDSIVIQDNSVSRKSPTIVIPQETASVKASSNYGDFSKTDTRYNFQPAERDAALVQNGFEKSELNKRLVDSGHIVLGFDERELAGKAVVINNPDTMMTGTLETPSGRILAEGEGGLNFVSKFGDIWANSKESKARTTARNLEKAQKENGGVAYLSLTRGSFENALNSHTGAKAGMGILEYFVEQGYISLEEFRNALKDSGRKYGIEFNATQSAKAIQAEIASKFFGVSDSTFERRGDFVKDVITHLAENGESGHKNIEKISNALGADRLGKKIQFAPTGIREAIGLMLSDKRANVDPSYVYAYIEVTGKISVEKTENGHKSYPWHIVQRDENGNKIRPRMLIPDKTNHVTDVFLNKEKKEVPRKGGATKLGSNQVGEAYGYVKEASLIPEGKERLKWQPAEGFRDWKAEQTTAGSLIKNSAGFVISRIGSKYRVYNPYKAVIGVFDSEEQAKRRVQREEPKR